MATGETDSTAFEGTLLIGWDGDRLHWVAADKAKPLDWGMLPELDQLDALASQFASASSVNLSLLRPVCSIAPIAVAEGVEGHVLALQHGIAGEGTKGKAFHTDRLGEGVAVIEAGHFADQDVFLSAFPMARWASATLGMIEFAVSEARTNGWTSEVRVDVGDGRALMVHCRNGALRWCAVTEDLAGDGLLYHVVNALHRDGVEVSDPSCRIVFSGLVGEDAAELKQFRRFFQAVELEPRHPELGAAALLMHVAS